MPSRQLLKFLKDTFTEVFAEHVVPLIDEVAPRFCRGCNHRDALGMPSPQQRDHDVCLMMAPEERIEVCLDRALQSVDDTTVVEDYVSIVGSAHLEWPEVQDPVYRQLHLYSDPEWRQQLSMVTLYKTLETTDRIVPIGYATAYPEPGQDQPAKSDGT